MTQRPRQVLQDAWTTVQLLPDGTTLERIAALLPDELLQARAHLVRDRADDVRPGPIPGTRYLFASLRATDLRQRYGFEWRGSAELRIERDDEETAASVRITVSGYSGAQDEDAAASAARVAWRLADALEHAFSLADSAGRVP